MESAAEKYQIADYQRDKTVLPFRQDTYVFPPNISHVK
jgi:hypothetical protein